MIKKLLWILSLVLLTSSVLWLTYQQINNDQLLLNWVKKQINTIHDSNPEKINRIHQKLPVVISLYEPSSREYYILQNVYEYITSIKYEDIYLSEEVDLRDFPYSQMVNSLLRDIPIYKNMITDFTILEITSLSCGYCTDSIETLLWDMQEIYKDKISIALVNAPWNKAQDDDLDDWNSLWAKAMICAKDLWSDWYYEFAMRLQKLKLKEWSIVNLYDDMSKEYYSFNSEKFKQCLSSDKTESEVRQLIKLRKDVGTWAPTHIFYNNKTWQYQGLHGNMSINAWIHVIEKLEPTL